MKVYKIGFLFFIVSVQNGLAQTAFFERIFNDYPVDSVILVFKKNGDARKAVYSDSTIKTNILNNNAFEKSVVGISIYPYQVPHETVTHFKCLVDIEFYRSNDSLLYNSYTRLIEDSVQVPGKKYMITNNFFKKSYVIRGMVFKLDYNYIIGMKRSDKGTSLILRKEIELE